MPADLDPDDDRPATSQPLPPADRLWRHPSELTGPGAAGPPMSLRADRRGRSGHTSWLRGLAVGAAAAGVVVAFGALWLTRPHGSPSVEQHAGLANFAITSTTFARSNAVSLPHDRSTLATGLVAPSLVLIEVKRDANWSMTTGVWVDRSGTFAAAAPALAGATEVFAVDMSGQRQLAHVIGTDPTTGVVALRVAHTSGRPPSVAQHSLGRGTTASLVSVSDGQGTAPGTETVSAEVTAADERAELGGTVYHDAISLESGGRSGSSGAVVVASDGSMIGMVLGTDRYGAEVAVPGDTLMDVAVDLSDDGRVSRATLGVRAVDDPAGARIETLTPGGAAAEAGLRTGDVITSIGSAPVRDASDLVTSVGSRGPGDSVSATVRRGSRTIVVAVKLD
ncbi:MAG: serine protease [Acidimicrobiales bacterium]|nr:serine protease [Acidimicrobiales bacterium]